MKILVSITIMVRDTGPILDELLVRLATQDVRFPYELVFLYFGQGTETLKRLKKYTSKIVQISPEEFNFGKSRDLVCSFASGEYIVTMSADALPLDTHWLQELISPMISGRVDIVQGEIACPEDGNHNYPDFFYWENDYGFYYSSEGKNFFKKYGPWGLSCVNMAFRKKIWQKTGFEGVSYCEDRIFQKRVFESGYIIIFNKKATVLHAHSYRSVKTLFRRVANEGFGWKKIGENYGINLLIKDLLRFDLHYLAVKALLNKRLKYKSELLFFLIRPVALYWGNKFAKDVYK